MKIIPTMASSMSGSMRGITASRNKGGQYFRGRTVPVNPATSYQTTVRGAFSTLMATWASVLTPAQRDGWDYYAAHTSWVDRLGQTIQLSGVNMFVRTNSVVLQENAVFGDSMLVFTDAPAVNMLGIAPQDLTVGVTNATGPPNVISLGMSWSNSADYLSTDLLFFWLSGPVNEGKKFFKGPYILSAYASADASPGTMALYDSTPNPAPYSGRYGTPGVGWNVRGYCRALLSDGRLSSRVFFDAGKIPTAS